MNLLKPGIPPPWPGQARTKKIHRRGAEIEEERNLCNLNIVLFKIASRRDHPAIPNISPAVSDDYHGLHVNLVDREARQRGHELPLPFPHCPANDCRRSFRATMAKDYLAGFLKRIGPALAPRVVYGENEIRLCCCGESSLDDLPRSQMIAKAHRSKIVHERCAQNGSGSIESGDPGNDSQEKTGRPARVFPTPFQHIDPLLPADIQNKPGHTVNSRIAAGNQGDIAAG